MALTSGFSYKILILQFQGLSQINSIAFESKKWEFMRFVVVCIYFCEHH